MMTGRLARGGDVDGEAVARVGGGAEVGAARDARAGLVADRDVDGVDQADRRSAAGVVASAGDRETEQVVGGDGETGQHGVAQGVGRVVEGQFEFGQAEHGVGLSVMAWPVRATRSRACGDRWPGHAGP